IGVNSKPALRPGGWRFDRSQDWPRRFCPGESDSYVNVRIPGSGYDGGLGVGVRRLTSALARGAAPSYSNAATVARITNVAISAAPSNAEASPSPVICQTRTAVPNSAPMYTGARANVSVVAVSSETSTSTGYRNAAI